ncbi:tetratricopeptide repeat protein [Bremerella alba]|uniref:tetratricopeptide repeat protein n=1 Tax=Bremerella alba TaxID=980252 RepID=UPI001A954A90|nr:tetratricopeptide repeat protein [Bremerella alba]
MIALKLVLFFPVWGIAQEQTLAQLDAQLRQAMDKEDHKQAVTVLDEMIKRKPSVPNLYYIRATENYKAENFRASVNDFDQLIKLQPSRSDSLWERGISCYYAGDYADGAQQFLDYQNYHDQDVENSVFRYLCLAKSEGLAKARETLIPIERDPRPGLQEVLELYRGKVTPEKLLEQMEQTNLTGEAAAGYRFYTLLYVGLYYVAEGKDDLAAKYLKMAADPKLLSAGSSRISTYMWQTAGIAHRDVLKRQKKQATEEK